MATDKVQIAKTRLVIDGSDVKNTVKDLSKSARDLRNELKGMEKGTDEYIKTSQNLNKVEHRLNEVKGEMKEVGKEWKIQQDNWSKGFTDMIGNVNIFGVRLGDLASKMGLVGKAITSTSGALKIFRMALISTGIGAIVVAIGTLIAYFSRMQSGIEFVSKAMAGLKASIDVIVDRLAMFGEGLFKILSGDFKEGFKQLGDSFKGIGQEIARETELAWDLQEALIALTKAENDHSLAAAQRRKIIAQLRLDAKDETKAIDERIAALRRANETEIQNMNEALALQRERVRITEEEYNRAESTEEDRKALIDERIKLEELETQSLTTRRRLIGELNTLEREQLAIWKAEREAAMKEYGKFGEIQATSSERNIEIMTAENEERARLLQERVDNELAAIDQQRIAQEEKAMFDQYMADSRKMIDQEVLASTSDLVGSTAAMLLADEQNRKKNAELIKSLSIGKVMADLFEEIQAIWKWANANPTNMLFPGAANIIAGIKTAAALVRGKMAVSNIAKQKFASGGYTGSGFGYADDSGYRPAGIVHEHEYVVPKWMTEDSVVKPVISWLESKRMRGYATGGEVSAASFDYLALEKTFEKMAAMMPSKVEAYITYDKMEASRTEMNTIKQSRSI